MDPQQRWFPRMTHDPEVSGGFEEVSQDQPHTAAEPDAAKAEVDRKTQSGRHESARFFVVNGMHEASLVHSGFRRSVLQSGLPQRNQEAHTLSDVFG